MLLTLPALTFADTRIPVAVRIERSDDGVVAKFKLAEPVERFSFEYGDGGKVRERTWSIATSGLTLEGNEVRSPRGDKVQDFTINVSAENAYTDAVYPCTIKLGADGRVIYASYFAGLQSAFDTTITFAASPTVSVLGLPRGGPTLKVDRTALAEQQAANLYVYFGPRSQVKQTALATYVIDPNAPKWLQAEIEKLAAPSLAFYRSKIGFDLSRKPLIMTTFVPGKAGALVADVTDGPNVAFRLLGDRWLKEDSSALTQVRHTAMHEYAHFWNSQRFRPDGNPTSRWLHEGAAEYWTRLAEANLKGRTDSDHIEAALNVCADRLTIAPLGTTRSNVAYPCGETIQWIADLGQRKKGKDYFDLWREMFVRADANGGTYTPAIFRELAGRDNHAVEDAMSLIIDRSGIERWNDLPTAVAKLGVALEARPPTEEAWRNTSVMHVLEGNCGNGFWTEDGWLKLETEDNCGPLSGKPAIDSINGHNLFTDAKGAFEAVDAACKVNGDIRFSRAGVAQTWTVKCNRPLNPPPPAFRLKLS
jgi:hypothetical protein